MEPEIADRYRRVAHRFTQRAAEVPEGAWGNPAPCEGWAARDVVRHMVEWMPSFLRAAEGPRLPVGPSVEDPVAAWTAMSDGIQALLDDPAAAGSRVDHPQAGTHALGDAIGLFFLGDVVIHTWDLARSTGLDETLDADEVHRMLLGMEPLDSVLRSSGHYGPRVEVPAGADEQTRLIGFTGRRP
ncbi:MAG: TIGR03086 family metal-binding protein [Acidimicrobiales bacterium]